VSAGGVRGWVEGTAKDDIDVDTEEEEAVDEGVYEEDCVIGNDSVVWNPLTDETSIPPPANELKLRALELPPATLHDDEDNKWLVLLLAMKLLMLVRLLLVLGLKAELWLKVRVNGAIGELLDRNGCRAGGLNGDGGNREG